MAEGEQRPSSIEPADSIGQADSAELPSNPSVGAPREGLLRLFHPNWGNRDEPTEEDDAGPDGWQGRLGSGSYLLGYVPSSQKKDAQKRANHQPANDENQSY